MMQKISNVMVEIDGVCVFSACSSISMLSLMCSKEQIKDVMEALENALDFCHIESQRLDEVNT
jgi:hypothetical protein